MYLNFYFVDIHSTFPTYHVLNLKLNRYLFKPVFIGRYLYLISINAMFLWFSIIYKIIWNFKPSSCDIIIEKSHTDNVVTEPSKFLDVLSIIGKTAVNANFIILRIDKKSSTLIIHYFLFYLYSILEEFDDAVVGILGAWWALLN